MCVIMAFCDKFPWIKWNEMKYNWAYAILSLCTKYILLQLLSWLQIFFHGQKIIENSNKIHKIISYYLILVKKNLNHICIDLHVKLKKWYNFKRRNICRIPLIKTRFCYRSSWLSTKKILIPYDTRFFKLSIKTSYVNIILN